MKNIKLLLPMVLLFVSCGIEEQKPYQNSFIHIMFQEASEATMSSLASGSKDYMVYLSSAPLSRNLEVYYEIQVGDGLQEGRDFERLTTSDTLVFLRGIYDMPIRIKWLTHELDLTKNNTLKIVLKGNNLGINLGLPGPDHNQSVFTITKT